MEVHHSTHPTHKKRWTAYLLEFLMLFLAVFLGFMAENQREHLVEKHRAKDYAKSFLSDLSEDSVEIYTALVSEKFRAACMDSVIAIYRTLKDQSTVPGKFYYYSRFVSNLYTVDWSSSTIHQLVQSGNLRYFKNKDLVKKINSYYAEQQLNDHRDQIAHETRMKVADLRNRILQGRYYSWFGALNFMEEQKGHVPSTEIDTLIDSQLPLSKEAAKYMDEYINLLSDWKWRQELALKQYPRLIQKAREIMEDLKDEYRLK